MNVQKSKKRIQIIGITFTILIFVSTGAIIFAAATDRPVAVTYSVTLLVASIVSTYVCRQSFNSFEHHEELMGLTRPGDTDKL